MDQPALINVCVVGLGLSGAGAANSLASTLPTTHRIVAISSTESAYYPISSLRGSVVEPWSTKSTIPLDSFFPAGSRHVLIVGDVLELSTHSLVLDKAHPELGPGTTIEFSHAVLAMVRLCVV